MAGSSKSDGTSDYEIFKWNMERERKRQQALNNDPDEAEIGDSNQVLFDTLLTDPVKRAKVLELLSKEGLVPNNETNKNKRGRKKKNVESSPQNKALRLFTEFLKSPISTLLNKNKNKNMGSPVSERRKDKILTPSAVQRRRALQKMESVCVSQYLFIKFIAII